MKSKKKLCFEADHSKSKRQYLPKTAEKFADTIDQAVHNATPRRKRAVIDKGFVLSAEEKSKRKLETKIVKHALQNLKKEHTIYGRKQYRQFVRSLVGKYTAEHSMRRALEHWQRVSAVNENEIYTQKRSAAFPKQIVDSI
jgi:hypothetical protein